MSVTMTDKYPEIPDFKKYEDHPLHREAKRKAMKERSKKRPAHRPICKLIKCPECGVWFDPNDKDKVK